MFFHEIHTAVNEETSIVSTSADKPKRKKVKVIEPSPVNSGPEASVISGQDGTPKSQASPQKGSKKLKSALKASKSSKSTKTSATCEVVKGDKLAKSKLQHSADSAIPDEEKIVKSKSKSVKSRAPTVPAPELSEHEDECLLNGFETEATGEADDSSDDDDNDEAFNQTSDFDPKQLPKASKRQKTKGKTENSDSVCFFSSPLILCKRVQAITHAVHLFYVQSRRKIPG